MWGIPRLNFGALLFIIHMNDISNDFELLYTIMYADDTNGIMSGNYMKIIIIYM